MDSIIDGLMSVVQCLLLIVCVLGATLIACGAGGLLYAVADILTGGAL